MTTLALAGAWLWGAFGGKVTERAGTLLGAAGKSAYAKFDWNRAAERYRGEMQQLYGTMRIIGMNKPVALADIFTDVFLLDKPSAWRRYNIEELQKQHQLDQHSRLDEQRHDGVNLVQRSERLMILGKPGGGKTTLLKHLVLQCTTGKLDFIPIFINLKAWADSGLALMPFLIQQFTICNFPNAQPFIEHILAEGRTLVLFDGLDEVNLEQGLRTRIISEVRDLADQYSRSRYVMTCRTAATNYQFERFDYCELADFTDKQIQTFVAHWFQRDIPKRDGFLTEFAKSEHDRLRDLARTPLLLTLLCLTYDETTRFPLRRAEIYKEALEALLKKWDSSRNITRDTIYRQLSVDRKQQMLARIAAETFSDNKLFMQQEDLAERIMAYMQRLPPGDTVEEIDGEVILRSIEAQHGLLVERAQHIYSFSHLTFHEYFAARFIVEHPSKQMFDSVVQHAHDSRWREVLLLTASLLDEDNAAIFFDSFDAHLRTMVRDNQPLLKWIERKDTLIAASPQASVRSLYLELALIIVAVSRFLEMYILIRNRARALDLTRDLVLVLALDPIYALARARDLAHEFGIHYAMANYSTRDFTTNALVRALALHRALNPIDRQQSAITKIQSDRTWTGLMLWLQVVAHLGIDKNYDDMRYIWNQQKASATAELQAALNQFKFPRKRARQAAWQQFTADLQTILIVHLDLGHPWNLNESQLDQLADYLAASRRMQECLDLATVADRDVIRDRLLRPAN